ncbi:MAG TPA: hypothetical protein DDW94_04465 [Deltaproteobacteria bacterium]|nr:MAG: hypothetical protein A2Z79_12920 [Deltaproteobacteria bacterium GWA2_55_82]OGQ62781.1 MAG: hypothetical protein A3I81_11695 [Deltaproteobacteria bacterium RIFCSPLOWO2_02_FULL_55_12]OIJ73499.1 MAG: hypothetical protein A2V21_303990 [Deltaproteobacteria bacterium GWC2_55_46]HBG46227.1 hypothetical protein [Deltaproteobacteria bacterium]HCY10134.1 hypothetical protein [Deltaproteobacteria bacterium]
MRNVWRFFSSLYLTITLAVLICGVSAWGSMVSMQNPRFFRAFDQEVLFPLIYSLGTGYLKLTLWVYLLMVLMALFAINTAVCTIDKVWSIAASRKPWQSFFPHIVHIGFLIALLGHLIGSIWGFRSYGNLLYKGESIPVPNQPGLHVRLDGVDMRTSQDGEIEYLKTGLTLLKDDKSVAVAGEAGINSPLIYKGIAFYHLDQGESPTGLVLDIDGSSVEVKLDGAFTAPDGSHFRLGVLYPDFAIDGSGRPYSRTGEFANPHIEVISGDGKASFLDVSAPGSRLRHGGHAITLTDYVYSPYVVLTINKDPGITYIIIGSIVLVAGMALLLFFRGERAELVRQRPGPPESAT